MIEIKHRFTGEVIYSGEHETLYDAAKNGGKTMTAPTADVIEKIMALDDYAEVYVVSSRSKIPDRFIGYGKALKPLAAAHAETVRRLEKAEKWRLALESLTPLGSEFSNDLEACLGYIQSRRQSDHDQLKQAVKERKAIERQLDYWNSRCIAAEKFIEETPCDPDITNEQILAHDDWQNWVEADALGLPPAIPEGGA